MRFSGGQPPDAAATVVGGARNPLELLRTTTDPLERTKLLRQLDDSWSAAVAAYVPTPVEAFLGEQLGIYSQTLILFAVQNPALAQFDLETQVRPAIRSLKAAGLPPNEIFFLLSGAKRLDLLSDPVALERWLDYASVVGLRARDTATFLQRAPRELFIQGTLHGAARVVSYLRSLCIREDYLGPRVVALEPGLLMRDVEAELQPAVAFLLSLGLETAHVGRLVCAYPQVLSEGTGARVAPLVALLRRLGASTAQAAQLLLAAPQLLSKEPEDALGPRLRQLRALGLREEQLRLMLGRSTDFLVAPGAIVDQVAFLRSQGLDAEQLRALLVASPWVLSERVLELEKKLKWLASELGGSMRDALAAPSFMGASFLQVIGPRFAFVQSKDAAGALPPPPGSRLTLDLSALVAGDDLVFCEAIGASINEYQGFRTTWEEDYSAQLSRDAAQEFQEEMRKLGLL